MFAERYKFKKGDIAVFNGKTYGMTKNKEYEVLGLSFSVPPKDVAVIVDDDYGYRRIIDQALFGGIK